MSIMTNELKQQIVETITERVLHAAKFSCAPLCRVTVPVPNNPSVMCTIVRQDGTHIVYTEQYVSDKYSPLDPQNGIIRRAFILDAACGILVPLDTSDFIISPNDAKNNKHWQQLEEVKMAMLANVLEGAASLELDPLASETENVKKAAEYSAKCYIYGMPADMSVPNNIMHEITNDLVLAYIGNNIKVGELIKRLCVNVYGERILKMFALERKKILSTSTYFNEWEYRLAKALSENSRFLEIKFSSSQNATVSITATAWDIKQLAINNDYGRLFSRGSVDWLKEQGFCENGKAVLKLEWITSISADGEVLYRKDDNSD